MAEDAESYQNGVYLRDVASPENEVLCKELKRLVFETINQMQDELRMAITLRELDGLSYEDIASIMNCPVGTVRSRIFRAREMIDQKISPLMQQ